MVGKTGFEPATPWSQTKCSTKLSYSPSFRRFTYCIIIYMARPTGVEPITFWSVVRRSIQLSYGRVYKWCRGPESNRYGSHLPQDFKSCASASSATPALELLWSGRRDSNPRPQPWQGCILPLNYFRIWCGWRDLNPHAVRRQILSLVRLPIPPHPQMVSHRGFEPLTLWLKVRCSTSWANGSYKWCRR